MEEEHAATLALLRAHRFENAFTFAYSERSDTLAARRLADDVPPDVKARRLQARQGWRWCVYACVCWGLGWGGAGVFLRFQAGWAW